MTERNYYEVLHINNLAEPEAIHAAYKRLSKEYQHNKLALFAIPSPKRYLKT